LHGLRIYSGQCCRWQITEELETEILLLARQMQNPLHVQVALRLIGSTLFHRGKFKAAYEYLEQAIALYNPQQHTHYSFDSDPEIGVAHLFRIASTLWVLGYPEQAQARMGEALSRARTLARPFLIVLVLDFACNLEHYLRRPQAAQALVAEMWELTTKYPFANFVASAKGYRGWMLAELGEPEAGIELLKQALDALHQMGTLLFLSDHSSLLVEAYRRANQFAQGVALVTEILAFIEETGERYWSAELHRLKGELLQAQGAAAGEVEGWYLRAIEIARRQSAKSLELRASVSLARLWQTQGRRADALHLVAAIYGWFTEGFDMPDLQAAQALLAELAP
jgi:predicted ATPase